LNPLGAIRSNTQISPLDKYPDLSTGDKYQINVHIPEDPNIPLELRPKKWFVTIVMSHN
jgi:hypothetical protein